MRELMNNKECNNVIIIINHPNALARNYQQPKNKTCIQKRPDLYPSGCYEVPYGYRLDFEDVIFTANYNNVKIALSDYKYNDNLKTSSKLPLNRTYGSKSRN